MGEGGGEGRVRLVKGEERKARGREGRQRVA